MGNFTTEKMNVAAHPEGTYDVENTGNVSIDANVVGNWRHSFSRDGERFFTGDQVRAIRAMKANHTYRAISEMFDCSAQLIFYVCKRAYYADIV